MLLPGKWWVCMITLVPVLCFLCISAFNLVGITAIRYISIRDPLNFNTTVTHGRAVAACVCVWVVTIIIECAVYLRLTPKGNGFSRWSSVKEQKGSTHFGPPHQYNALSKQWHLPVADNHRWNSLPIRTITDSITDNIYFDLETTIFFSAVFSHWKAVWQHVSYPRPKTIC